MPRSAAAHAFRPSLLSFLQCSRSGSYQPRLGPTQRSKPGGWKRTAFLVACSPHNRLAALLPRTGLTDRPRGVNAIYVSESDGRPEPSTHTRQPLIAINPTSLTCDLLRACLS